MEKSHKNALLRYFDNQDLIIIVSGEHFYQGQKSNFFKELERYVFNGGALLATSWISWINNTYKYVLIDMLPFKHQNSRDLYHITKDSGWHIKTIFFVALGN